MRQLLPLALYTEAYISLRSTDHVMAERADCLNAPRLVEISLFVLLMLLLAVSSLTIPRLQYTVVSLKNR